MTEGQRGLGLVLSGGGFRAMLFHLGVVRYLFEIGQLERVTHICSVSGGSILAAHLVLNWERYTGTQETFDTAANELTAFAHLDVRGRIIRRFIAANLLVLPLIVRLLGRFVFRFRFSRADIGGLGMLTRLLQQHYTRLYRGRRLYHLGPAVASQGRPEVHFLAVSLTTGSLASFSRRGLWVDERPTPRKINTETLPISLAVTASSAFPPLFPPLRVDHKLLGESSYAFPHTHYLADGGVYDNLGIHRLRRLQEEQEVPLFDAVVVSDAGARSDWETDDSFASLIPRNIRATDLLMSRVTELDHGALRAGTFLKNAVVVSIHDAVSKDQDATALPPETQRSVATVRTDLDKFSRQEIRLLTGHGHTVAKNSLRLASLRPALPSTPEASSPDPAAAPPPDTPEPIDQTQLPLRDSARVRARIFSLRDCATGFTILLLTLWGLALVHYVAEPLLGKGRVRQYDRVRIAGGELRRAKTPDDAERALATLRISLPGFPDFSWTSASMEWLVEPLEVQLEKDAVRGHIGEWHKSKQRPKDLDRAILRLASAYGHAWRKESRSEARSLFADLRSSVYRRASQTVNDIAFYSTMGDRSGTEKDIEAFWTLYWGELPLVGEGPEVIAAMVEVGYLLDNPADLRSPARSGALLQASARLTAAINRELGTSQEDLGAPRSFSFHYEGPRPYTTNRPGKRIWLRIRDGLWSEILPDGTYQFLPVIRREQRDDCSGTVVYRAPNEQVEFFIPDRACKATALGYRHPDTVRNKWQEVVSKIEDVL